MADRDTKTPALDRRQFLKNVGAGTAAGAAAAVVAATSATPAVAEAARDDAAYRETEHVRRYYALASRF